MKVKIVKIERLPKNEFGLGDPEVTIELSDGERLSVHLYEHSAGTITATKARRMVSQRIADAIRNHQNRMALCDALAKLGEEFEVNLEDAEL